MATPKIIDQISIALNNLNDRDVYVKVKLFISDEKVEHLRQCYNIVDIICEVGGIIVILSILGTIIVDPFINHSFKIDAIEKNFFAKYKGRNMAESKNKEYLKKK